MEPSCGAGVFIDALKNNNRLVAVEIDSDHCPEGARNIDFFDYPTDEKFDLVIGNPPYVAHKALLPSTKDKLAPYSDIFDLRTNLYLFFIYKSILHLKEGGEIVFITPRDFLKATSAKKLNELMFKLGSITHFYETGDSKVFQDAAPNCAIWRFKHGDMSHKCLINSGEADYVVSEGQVVFLSGENIRLGEIFTVKVGGVSGADDIFRSPKGNEEFVASFTNTNGETAKYYYGDRARKCLRRKKKDLLERRIKKFDDGNWWKWGRDFYHDPRARVYVNCKTRSKKPFFTHKCKNYDGSVLALFINDGVNLTVKKAVKLLNSLDWESLGFLCDGRYLFSQRSLENAPIPKSVVLQHVKDFK